MSFDIEHLYSLLPAYHRERDEDQQGPLKAILSLFAEQIGMLEDNLEQLYDDQFIETCSDWIIPYLGKLTETRNLYDFPDIRYNQRAQVANTIAYRRRKGTAAVIEQLARDVTGWAATVVEYFQLTATTQYLNHLRPARVATADLKSNNNLEYLHTPFDKVSRTVDVRNISKKRGRYNVPNIGIFLWRHRSYSLTQSSPYRVDDYRYCFDTVGNKISLYNLPVSEDDIADLATPDNIPHQIKRYALKTNLEKYYGEGKSILIYMDGEAILPPVSSVLSDIFTVCHLSDKLDSSEAVIGWYNVPQNKIAIDPELGRIAFPTSSPPPQNVQVTFHYGAMGEFGGGEYGRADSLQNNSEKIVRVPDDETTLQAAINSLGSEGGIVEIQDNGCYKEQLMINIPGGKRLEIRAVNKKRPLLRLIGEVVVSGEKDAEFSINGLFIAEGYFKVPSKNTLNHDNELRTFLVQHSTIETQTGPDLLSPPTQGEQPAIIVESSDTTLEIDKSVLGSIRVIDTADIHVSDSILDAGSVTGVAIAGLDGSGPSGSLIIKKSTIVGKVHTLQMNLVTNSILIADPTPADGWEIPVIADRIQEGCIRYSYIPPGSKVPGPYRCVPSIKEDNINVKPLFESLHFGNHGYCQLSAKCSTKISQGADDDSEMGVYHSYYQPQRIRNLRTQLDEYLRFGLEAGIFLM